MKIQDLRGKTDDELQTLLTQYTKEAFNLRFQKVGGIVEKTGRIREVRRTIARVNTLLNQPADLRAVAPKAEKPKKAKAVKSAAPKAKKAESEDVKEAKKAPAKKAAAKKKAAE